MHTDNSPTHSVIIGYLLWILGFLGAHRFYYGKQLSGTLYFFTLGLLLIGWIVDLFLIPALNREADIRFNDGRNRFQCRLDSPGLPRSIRHPPDVYGKMADGSSVSLHCWRVRHRLYLRSLDAERPDKPNQRHEVSRKPFPQQVESTAPSSDSRRRAARQTTSANSAEKQVSFNTHRPRPAWRHPWKTPPGSR